MQPGFNDFIDTQRKQTAIFKFQCLGEVALGSSSGSSAESFKSGDVVGCFGCPIDLTKLQISFIGQFFQGCTTGKQIIDIFQLIANDAAGTIQSVFIQQLGTRLFKRGFLSGENCIHPEQGRAKAGFNRVSDARFRQREHGLARIAKRGFGHVT